MTLTTIEPDWSVLGPELGFNDPTLAEEFANRVVRNCPHSRLVALVTGDMSVDQRLALELGEHDPVATLKVEVARRESLVHSLASRLRAAAYRKAPH